MWKTPLATVIAAGCSVVLLAGCSGSSKTSTAAGTASSAGADLAGSSFVTSSSPAMTSSAGTSVSSSMSSSTPASSTPASSTPASSTPASSASASGSAGGSTSPATAAQLKKLVLQPTDLPAGWKGTPPHPDPKADSAGQAVGKCVGGRDTDKDMVAEADSDDFSLGDNSLSSSASSYKSKDDIASDVQMLRSPKLESCLVQMVKGELASSLPAGAKVESVSMKITPGAAGGPSNVVATGAGRVKVSANDRQVAVYLDMVFITGPLIEADLEVETLGAPLPATMLKTLVATLAARAAKG